ncbi:hypothetical protein THTE_1185 [Thermogutta terrifontis]|uniref:Uncharacterized protein n=1 Tax=Thermogutta terrifontis TaxID=1331910 RepID=A0A286RCY4_9BACT|nr:hypothetical protein THTE_1185 [Thermogutta terrifontis]
MTGRHRCGKTLVYLPRVGMPGRAKNIVEYVTLGEFLFFARLGGFAVAGALSAGKASGESFSRL